MAASNLARRKKNTIFVVSSLSLGLVLYLCMTTIAASYDTDKWLSDYVIGDFYLTDKSASSEGRIYNLKNQTITKEMLKELESKNGIENIQNEYFTETSFTLTKSAKEGLIRFYDIDDRTPYLQMARMPEWVKAYDEMCKSGKLAAKMYGADQWVLEQCEVIQGSIDWEKYKTGKYVIASAVQYHGGKSDNVFAIGDQISIDGQTYEMMATIDEPHTIVAKESLNTLFSYSFYINSVQFQKNYPDAPIYRTYLEVENGSLDETEAYLKNYKDEKNANLAYMSKASYLKEFEKEIDAQTVMGKMAGIIIAIIGVLNYVNTMVTSYESQKTDVAMMQCIGMGKKQAIWLFICESLLLMGLTFIVSLVLGSLCSLLGVRNYLSGSDISTYRFTLLPLLQVAPILLLISFVLPWLSFRNIEKQTLIERLTKVE